MFTFHKPKVFRSTSGCCICKAKSSSSRFTDSKKYEDVFMDCFHLDEMRSGEICNACVLLVKRYSKLPKGTSKNWSHVVDARSGPGIKSMVKNKTKTRKEDSGEKNVPETFARRNAKVLMRKKRKVCKNKIRRNNITQNIDQSDFLHTIFWIRKPVCCGTVFVGPSGQIAIDNRYYNPCCTQKDRKPVSSEDEDMLISEESDDFTAARNLSEVCAAEVMANRMETDLSMSSVSKSSSVSGDFDEGFFDKPAISPTSSRGSSTPPPNDEILMSSDMAEDLSLTIPGQGT